MSVLKFQKLGRETEPPVQRRWVCGTEDVVTVNYTAEGGLKCESSQRSTAGKSDTRQNQEQAAEEVKVAVE